MRAKPNQGASAGVPPALEEEGAQGDVLEAAVDLRLAGVHGEDRRLPLPPGGPGRMRRVARRRSRCWA